MLYLLSVCPGKLTTKFEEELEKCISIFHLPPFSVYYSNNQMNDRVEDRVFQPFIFHPYLPSSTCCFKARMLYRPLIINHKLCVFDAKLLQKSEMRKDIVIELSYKGFG